MSDSTASLFLVGMEGPLVHGRPDSPAMRVLAGDAGSAARAAATNYSDAFRVASLTDLGPPRPAGWTSSSRRSRGSAL